MSVSFSAALAMILLAAAPQEAAAAPQGSDAAACAPGGGPAVLVNVDGLKDRSGIIKVELYPPNDQDFTADDTVLIAQHKTFRRVSMPTPQSGPVSLCIRAPKPGTYALLFTHDRDGKNKFDFWQDGAGVPSNVRIGRAKPKSAQALVQVGAGILPVTIHTQYLRGLRGFAPLAG